MGEPEVTNIANVQIKVNTIQVKRGTSNPVSLLPGELFLNLSDSSLYYGNDSGVPTKSLGQQGIQGVPGNSGANGREIELRSNATHLQQRYVGDVNWVDLLALSTIQGGSNDNLIVSATKPLTRVNGSSLQQNDIWIDYLGGETWFWDTGSFYSGVKTINYINREGNNITTTAWIPGEYFPETTNVLLVRLDGAVLKSSTWSATNNFTMRLLGRTPAQVNTQIGAVIPLGTTNGTIFIANQYNLLTNFSGESIGIEFNRVGTGSNIGWLFLKLRYRKIAN
jgi:hypothetical protein